MNIRNIFLLLALATLFACEPSLDEFTTSAGSADFSKYVSIGNSLTAGFADGDVYLSGQLNSFPAILAYQMQAAGGGEFKQPLMYDNYGFGNRLLLDASIPSPRPAGVTPDERNFASVAGDGPFNNMGVPGAKSFHLVPGAEVYSNLNPYYRRFAAQPGVSTVLGEAMAQNATFFTAWVGSNDVLAYAYEGGASDSITNPALLQQAVTGIFGGMASNGAKGAVANIPYITDIPFFTFMNTKLPYYGLVLTEQAQADALNAGYAPLNAFIKSIGSTDTLAFNVGPNGFVIVDKDIPWGIRQMKEGDLFLLTLPTDSVKNYGYGSQTPIPDNYVLTTTEVTKIKNATDSYNLIIEGLATQLGLALVDMNEHMNTLATTGITVDGITFTEDFITGKAFSLDGIHLTAQGNAVVANFFIDAINAKFGADLKHVSPRLYPGIYYFQ